MRSNPIALAMANYVRTVDNTFGLVSDPCANVFSSDESEAQNG